MIDNISISQSCDLPINERELEITERKGLGHPDTISDSLMNAIAVSYGQYTLQKYGTIPHHNFDKCLLTAGSSRPKFGGGKIISPVKVFMGDRATVFPDMNLDDLMIDTGRKWFKKNIRYLNPACDIEFHNETQQGSGDLRDIFSRPKVKYPGSNDTSATVGYYPFSNQERLIKELEAYANSLHFHKQFPWSGEDVKIMAIRQGTSINLTISIAMIDMFINNTDDYIKKKSEIKEDLLEYAKNISESDFSDISLTVNALDNPARGVDGLYLTVSGTSLESGDSGQVGRGNDPSGVIPLCRPMASEAAPGKNAVSHVGKIYSALSFKIARSINEQIPGVLDTYCWLVSRIGTPINNPLVVGIQYNLDDNLSAQEKYTIPSSVRDIVNAEFNNLLTLCDNLSNGTTTLW